MADTKTWLLYHTDVNAAWGDELVPAHLEHVTLNRAHQLVKRWKIPLLAISDEHDPAFQLHWDGSGVVQRERILGRPTQRRRRPDDA